MKILVTGSAGFVGRHLLAQLVHNHTVIEADIVNGQDLTRPISLDHAVDLIIHLAAKTFVDESFQHPADYIYNNVMSTQRVIEYAQKYMIKLLHVSTDEVLGPSTHQTYSGAYRPTNPYAASKAAAEMLVIASGLQYLIVRSNNIFGPGQSKEFNLIPRSIDRLRRGLPIQLHGDGQSRRRYIYVQDYVEALLVVMAKEFDGTIYNIASDEEYSNIQVAEMLIERLSGTIEFVPDRPQQDQSYYLPNSVVQVKTSLKKGLQMYL